MKEPSPTDRGGKSASRQDKQGAAVSKQNQKRGEGCSKKETKAKRWEDEESESSDEGNFGRADNDKTVLSNTGKIQIRGEKKETCQERGGARKGSKVEETEMDSEERAEKAKHHDEAVQMLS